MSIPIIYANTQYVAEKHIFKTIPQGTDLSLTSLVNIPSCNVMTLVNSNVGIGTTNPRQLLDVQGGNAIVSGSIGIGTTVALASLHTTGDIRSPAFTGMVVHFAMDSVPTGWLLCNGSAISRTTYASLFSVIGTTHGVGDGSTTFTIPELRGEFIRAADKSRGVDSGRVFASAQSAAMLNHTHTGSYSGTTDSVGNHTHSIEYRYSDGTNLWHKADNNYVASGSSGGQLGTGTATSAINSAGSHDHDFSGSVTTGNPSVGGGTETRPRNVALLACIKY